MEDLLKLQLFDMVSEKAPQQGSNVSSGLKNLRSRLTSVSLASDASKHKRSLVPESTAPTKRPKLAHKYTLKALSAPVQEAISRFRETSEVELDRLRKEGYDTPSSISKLVDKMKTDNMCNDKSGNSSACQYSREDIELVMELSGFNEEGALRALVLRDELTKLRVDGFNHPEAIDELSLRIRRLVGRKRKISVSAAPTESMSVMKKLRKSMEEQLNELDMGLFAPLKQRLSFDGLGAFLLPPRKRVLEDNDSFIVKRQKLLDALDNEATSLQDMGDESMCITSALISPITGSEDEESDIVLPERLSLSGLGTKHSSLFEPDNFYVQEEGNEDNEESDGEDSFSTDNIPQEEQHWRRNPLHSKMFTISPGSKNSEFFL